MRTVQDTATIAWTNTVAGQSSGAVVDDSISNAKLANVATATFKGRTTAGTGDPEDLTVAQAKTLLSIPAVLPPGDAQFVVLSASATLTDERVLTAGTGIGLTDGGAGSTITVAINDAELLAIAGLTSAANKGIQFTGSGTAATYDLTTAGKALLDDADATAQRVTLGLVIGTNVQAQDATLLSIAALGTAADKMLYTTGVDTWAELAVTSVGRGLLDDTTTAAQLATLTARGQGKETIFIPAAAMTARTTNGPSTGTVEQTTNKNMVKSLDFDTTTQEFAQFAVWLPKSWNLGTVTFQPSFSQLTTAAGGVVFGLAGVAVSTTDDLDVAFGTAATSTTTAGTLNKEYQGPESAAITIAGTPAAGDRIMFQINRTVADGSDTLAQDARLHGIRLFFTTNAATDT